jgi:hypothetical protein
VLKARLTAEAGAVLMRAIEAASDALFREQGSVALTDEEKHREAGQRRADAIELLAERALAAGFGPPADEAEAPISGTRADRYQVVLHVEAETLSSDAEPGMSEPGRSEPGRSELDDGTRVTCETSRRLSCDASLLTVTEKSDGTVLDVGRKTRTISGPRDPRPRLPLPRLRAPVHGRASREALGRGRRDEPRQLPAALSIPSSAGARGCLDDRMGCGTAAHLLRSERAHALRRQMGAAGHPGRRRGGVDRRE